MIDLGLKDIELKAISFGSTAYGMYTLGGMLNPINYGLESQIVYPVAGLIGSFIYAKKVTEPLAKSEKSGNLILASLPFVISWVLITPNIYNKYMDVYINSQYSELKTEQKTLIKAQKVLDSLTIKIEKTEAKVVLCDRSELINYKANKESHISQNITLVGQYRAEWKKSKHKSLTKYKVLINEYESSRGDIGRGATAIKNIATMIYENHTLSLKEKFDFSDAQSTLKAINKTDLVSKKEAEQKVKRLGTVNQTIKKIEAKDTLGVNVFYMIMAMFGFFMEVFLTHVSYWMRGVATAEIKRDFILEDISKSPKLFLETIGVEPNHKVNAIFASIRCYCHGEKLTEKNIEKYSYFTNPNRNAKYKTGRIGLKAKRTLTEYGFFDSENPNVSQNELVLVIQEFIQ